MRRDMPKVIVERPRRGSFACYGEVRRKENRGPIEELPTKQGMRRPYRWAYQKEFNEHLSPLYRYLRGQVGRPWNDVFSEICERLHTRSTVHQHVRDHVGQYVEVNCSRDGGRLYYRRSWFGNIPLSDQLYVDPDTGILRYAPPIRDGGRRVAVREGA